MLGSKSYVFFYYACWGMTDFGPILLNRRDHAM